MDYSGNYTSSQSLKVGDVQVQLQTNQIGSVILAYDRGQFNYDITGLIDNQALAFAEQTVSGTGSPILDSSVNR